MESVEREEEYQEYYDKREARLKKLGLEVEQWEPREDDASEEDVDDYYEEVGRLKSRLEATRRRLEAVKETRDDWKTVRDDIDQAISELEEAIAKAAPRFQ
jgi:vacuolar-type H+-ATPase subunit I/STV1